MGMTCVCDRCGKPVNESNGAEMRFRVSPLCHVPNLMRRALGGKYDMCAPCVDELIEWLMTPAAGTTDSRL